MANLYGYQFAISPVAGVVNLYGKITISGTAGAPTLVAASSKQMTSISRTSAGLYVLKLTQTYNSFLGMDVNVMLASGVPAAPVVSLVSETVASNNASTGQKVTFQLQNNGGGSATDPDSGTVLYIHAKLKNSSV